MESEKYYVFEMSARDRKQPLRQVNKSPLALDKAKQLARIGATKGKHDRAVTNSPKSTKFRIIAQYSAGTGKDVAIMYRRGSGGGGGRRKSKALAPNPVARAEEQEHVPNVGAFPIEEPAEDPTEMSDEPD